ncbi:hypothetical protein EVAR_29625_1 [Eumeta japonica]|uniref:Uncharacterized protein n=1 Tax=Eumeta variegata TaxID=151549 RepID=A0A4C1W7N4_EUMVA|nr:hypothetical protein EVAR_29625_1 [Eumeta japonica]
MRLNHNSLVEIAAVSSLLPRSALQLSTAKPRVLKTLSLPFTSGTHQISSHAQAQILLLRPCVCASTYECTADDEGDGALAQRPSFSSFPSNDCVLSFPLFAQHDAPTFTRAEHLGLHASFGSPISQAKVAGTRNVTFCRRLSVPNKKKNGQVRLGFSRTLSEGSLQA